MEKEFKTYTELIELLKTRGISFNDESSEEYTENVLKKIGYYNLINGYNKLFLIPGDPEKYKPGSTVREIHALYQFDKTLRHIFFKYLLTVEIHMKSLISYHFSEVHGHKNYLTYDSFNTSCNNATTMITSLIAELQKQMSSRVNDPCISHYLTQYGYVPLWVLTNILTFGTISKFYSLMKTPERQKISRAFSIMDNELENHLLYLSAIRNFCAHGNRLYCYNTKMPLKDMQWHTKLGIVRDMNGEYNSGKRDLFACMLALKSLLSNNDMKRMCSDISYALKTLDKKLTVLNCDIILTQMGFPSNWKRIMDIK